MLYLLILFFKKFREVTEIFMKSIWLDNRTASVIPEVLSRITDVAKDLLNALDEAQVMVFVHEAFEIRRSQYLRSSCYDFAYVCLKK